MKVEVNVNTPKNHDCIAEMNAGRTCLSFSHHQLRERIFDIVDKIIYIQDKLKLKLKLKIN